MWDKIIQGVGQVVGGLTTLASKPLFGQTYDATFKPTDTFNQAEENKRAEGLLNARVKNIDELGRGYNAAEDAKIKAMEANRNPPSNLAGVANQMSDLYPGDISKSMEQKKEQADNTQDNYLKWKIAELDARTRAAKAANAPQESWDHTVNGPDKINPQYEKVRSKITNVSSTLKNATDVKRFSDVYNSTIGNSGFPANGNKLWEFGAREIAREQGIAEKDLEAAVKAMAADPEAVKNASAKAIDFLLATTVVPAAVPGPDYWKWYDNAKRLAKETGITITIPTITSTNKKSGSVPLITEITGR
jgi:hypothetical protein